MKNLSIAKSALLLGFISSTLIASQANAFERFTWSELVTGSSKNPIVSEKLSVVSEWCGLTRIVKSKVTNFEKLKDAQQIIINKAKYSNNAIFKAVMDLRYTYLYCFKDMKKADEVLSHLEGIPELENKALAEKLFASFSSEKLLTNEFYESLYSLRNKAGVFPYDNGYMPVITQEHASSMLAIKEMLDGKGKQENKSFGKAWKDIPSDILYLIATDQKENAYKQFLNRKSSFDKPTAKLLDDFLYPIYKPAIKSDRKFLTGVFCIEKFPGLGMDLINEALSDSQRVSKPEHALACLSDTYSRHNAYNEAQKVLKLLQDYYPDSIWLK